MLVIFCDMHDVEILSLFFDHQQVVFSLWKERLTDISQTHFGNVV